MLVAFLNFWKWCQIFVLQNAVNDAVAINGCSVVLVVYPSNSSMHHHECLALCEDVIIIIIIIIKDIYIVQVRKGHKCASLPRGRFFLPDL